MPSQPVSQQARSLQKKTFVVVAGILTGCNAVSLLYGWFSSADVKGWRPFILWLMVMFTCLYALVYSVVARVGRLDLWFSVVHSLSLGALCLAVTVLYYVLTPPWHTKHIGSGSTLLQTVVFSPYTLYLMCGCFLLAAAMYAAWKRLEADSVESVKLELPHIELAQKQPRILRNHSGAL